MREGLHAAMLSGVTSAEDPWRAAAVCLPPAPFQDFRVRGLWLHVQPAGRVLPARAPAAPRKPRPAQVLPQTPAGVTRPATDLALHAVSHCRLLHVKPSAAASSYHRRHEDTIEQLQDHA